MLALLVANVGRMVSREELRSAVWGAGTHVDFEQGLNHCIKEVRAALGDQADAPLYIETLPRRGYRFIGRLSTAADERAAADGTAPARPTRAASARLTRQADVLAGLGGVRLWTAILAATATLGLLLDRALSPGRESRRFVLAVFPFQCSGETGSEAASFAEGLTEELNAQLGDLQPQRLAVLARRATLRYRNATREVLVAGRELGADFVIEGSVTRDEQRVRVSARLIRVADGASLWTSTYDQQLRDVLRLQRRLAAAMVGELSVALRPVAQSRLAAAAPERASGPRFRPAGTAAYSSSRSQAAFDTSLGMRQSPRGDRLTVPTFGPSGNTERLNCCSKKRSTNTRSQRLSVAVS